MLRPSSPTFVFTNSVRAILDCIGHKLMFLTYLYIPWSSWVACFTVQMNFKGLNFAWKIFKGLTCASREVPLPTKTCLQIRYCERVCFCIAFHAPTFTHGHGTSRKDLTTASRSHLTDQTHWLQCLCVHVQSSCEMTPQLTEPQEYKTCIFSWRGVKRCEKSATC